LSHFKERKEKHCLNCNAEVQGRYCQVCGQENLEPKETVWHFITHFFNDITHFDGKFFSTVRYLIAKPGFLSKEYIAGKRMTYLHPIRMYVFTSAFFFIIFFSLFKADKIMKGSDEEKEVQLKELIEARESLDSALTQTSDTVVKAAMHRTNYKLDRRIFDLQKEFEEDEDNDSVNLAETKVRMDSLEKEIPYVKGLSKGVQTAIDKKNEKKSRSSKRIGDGFSKNIDISSKLAYDSLQKELPEDKRDGWFKKVIVHNTYDLNDKMKKDKKEAFTVMFEKSLHTLPQVLFLSLPTFALILMLLYVRHKNYYYVDHGVFSIHVFCATFLLLLIYFSFSRIQDVLGYSWLNLFKGLTVIGIYFYLYKAMRNFYGQGRIKTITKYLILLFLSFICMAILTTTLIIFSLIKFS